MGAFKNEQRRFTHRGRVFHFISYQAREANATRKETALPDMWYLVSSNNRWPALPHHAEQPDSELEPLLLAWLDQHVFGPAAPADVSRSA